MNNIKDLYRKKSEAIEHLQRNWTNRSDVRDWAVAWSGGKDSTVTLSLLIKALEDLPSSERNIRKAYVVMSDTRVENPILESYMREQVSLLKEYVKKNELPVEVKMVYRPVENSYFVLTLGRGYFLPLNNGQGRWCTGRLKIDPQDKALKEINPSHIVIGTRLTESSNRRASMEKFSTGDRKGTHATLTETQTYMIIGDWTVEDVWGYLSENDIGWSDTFKVRRLYREATGECAVANPKEVEEKLTLAQSESCGARFGCWLCPVITSDRSTEAMADYHGWLEPLSWYREMQQKVYGAYVPPRPEGQRRKERSKVLRHWEAVNEQINRIVKCGYNRAGTRMKNGQGTFTVEARKYLFNYLLRTQREVNIRRAKDGLPYFELITQEEIELIERQWEDDIKNAPHVVTNVEGIDIKELDDLIEGKIPEDVFEDYMRRFNEEKERKKLEREKRKNEKE